MAEEKGVHDHEILGVKPEVSHEESIHWGQLTDEELVVEKKLRRKIDALIMPLIVLVYILNCIDRNNYPAARLQGLEKDLHLVGSQYQVGLSVLFVGYVLMQVPSNLLLNYAGRPSLYLGFFVIAWGLVSALTSQVKTYHHIVACRFTLGLVEAPFFAGVIFYLSKWYTKKELSLRMSIFYSGSLVSGAFGNLIAAGILSGLSGSRGMAAWQWLYIIEGVITVFVGLVILFVLPDFPHTWKGLSAEMKHVANRRLAIDAAEADVDLPGGRNQFYGLKLALTDSKTYVLAIGYMCIIGTGGFQNFFPTLTATLGYSHTVSLLLVAPPYVFVVFWSFGHSLASDRLGNRFWFWMYPIPLTIIGFIIFMVSDSFGAKYFSFFLMNFVFTMNPICYAWVSNAIPRPPAKRAAALAFINSLGNSASIWTPFTYIKSSAPHYRPALGCCIAFQCVAALCGVILRIILTKQNKELERLEQEDVALSETELKKLRKTADFEGIDIAAARQLQKGYRFML